MAYHTNCQISMLLSIKYCLKHWLVLILDNGVILKF
jgi:hypothetical protein